MKKLLLCFFGLLCSAPSINTFGQQVKKIQTVCLDAGHGGHDAGARGGSGMMNEKDITLAVTLKVGKLINDSLKSVKPIFTRTTDVFIPLPDRHKIANQAGADLFVAIHVNSSPGSYEKIKTGSRTMGKGRKKRTVPVYKTIHHRETAAHGTETYVLGLHRLGQKEDAISEYSETVTQEPGLLNENDPETAIVIAQYSQAFLKQSVDFAQKLQDNFAQRGRKDLGVKQAGWEVIAGCVMPGVLTEIGFINNVQEEQYLNTELGQNEVAWSIFDAIRRYKREVERL